MKAIGTNLSNASFILTRPYRNARKHGGRYRRGMHDALVAEGALLTVTQMTTMTIMMKRIAMMAMTIADTIERAIVMTHDLPRHWTLSPYARATTAIYPSKLCGIQSKTMAQ